MTLFCSHHQNPLSLLTRYLLLYIYCISAVELMFTVANHWEVKTRGVSLMYSKLQLFVLVTKVKYLSFFCFLFSFDQSKIFK